MRAFRMRFATALEIEATRDAAAEIFRQADREENPEERRLLNRRAMNHILSMSDPMERDA